MTPDERDLLNRFLTDLSRAQPGAKDAEAAQAIDQALRSNPDAAYVLVQHAIVSDAALHDAQNQVADLQRRVEASSQGAAPEPPRDGPSFLGSLFGRSQPNNQSGAAVGAVGPWAGRPASAVPATPAQAGYQGQTAYAQNYPPQGQPGPFSGGGGLGGFLRNAGTTAAGVAGGAFLFEGLSGLFGGGRGGMGMGGMGGFGGGGFGQPAENVTINEYGDGGNSAGGDWGNGGGGGDPTYDSDNGDPGGDDYS